MKKTEKITDAPEQGDGDKKAILLKHFPQCFDKNGALDVARLQQALADEGTAFSRESYTLDWLGKSYARVLAGERPQTLLAEDEAFNAKAENAGSGNMLIKGDNLEALKHLSHAYREKIKMIYIDPPYNTGGDGFVYHDNRRFTAQELSRLAGMDEERAQRILDFTRSRSNSHSAWLTFMYPRLHVARRLLREDGVIFISIDDNEVAQLRMMMDEIFGEENFISSLVWISNLKGRQIQSVGATQTKEHCLVYAASAEKAGEFKIDAEKAKKDMPSAYKGLRHQVRQDEHGAYVLKNELHNTNSLFNERTRPNLVFDIYYSPESEEITFDDPGDERFFRIAPRQISGGGSYAWRWSRDKILKDRHNLAFVYDDSSGGFKIYTKIRDFGVTGFKDIIPDIDTSRGKADLKQYGMEKSFLYPKPLALIKHLLRAAAPKHAVILDFFAGTGTTGDAVMQLNAEDGGSRRYILVQLDEPIDAENNPTAYDFVKNELGAETPSVFDITKERLIRAARKIKAEHAGEAPDLGFKIFMTKPIWADYEFIAEKREQGQELFDETQLTADDLKALLLTWRARDGMPFTQSVQPVDLGGYTACYEKNRLYLLGKGFTRDHLQALLDKLDADKTFNPAVVIAFGYHFKSAMLREIADNIENYVSEKNLEMKFITRY